jgi:hypothetical protein
MMAYKEGVDVGWKGAILKIKYPLIKVSNEERKLCSMDFKKRALRR